MLRARVSASAALLAACLILAAAPVAATCHTTTGGCYELIGVTDGINFSGEYENMHGVESGTIEPGSQATFHIKGIPQTQPSPGRDFIVRFDMPVNDLGQAMGGGAWQPPEQPLPVHGPEGVVSFLLMVPQSALGTYRATVHIFAGPEERLSHIFEFQVYPLEIDLGTSPAPTDDTPFPGMAMVLGVVALAAVAARAKVHR